MHGVSEMKVGGRRLESIWEIRESDYLSALRWSPDGALLAVGTADGAVAVYAATDGQLCWRKTAHSLGTAALAWSADSQALASGGNDTGVTVWAAADGTAFRRLDTGKGWVSALAWSDTNVLASIAGRELKLWNVVGELQYAFPAAKSTLTGLQWLSDGHLLTSCYGGVDRWRPGRSEPTRHYPWKGSLLGLAVSPDEGIIAASCQESAIHLWFTESGEDFQMGGYPAKVQQMDWSRDSRYFATGGGAALIVWDCGASGPQGTEPDQVPVDRTLVSALAFGCTGNQVASGGEHGLVIVYDAGARKPIAHLVANAAISTLAWRFDDRLLAIGSSDGSLRICSPLSA